MHHKYHTRALVLARAPQGEANALITLLTDELGLVRARAQGIRKPSAKLAPALQTFAESDVMLVRGAEGWRVAGAILVTPWYRKLSSEARTRAGRVSGLLMRLVAGETAEQLLLPLLSGFFFILASKPESTHDAAECLAALRLLSSLGLDAGALPGSVPEDYDALHLAEVERDRIAFVQRINRGIAASGL